MNYATELVLQEDGTYTLEVQSSQLLTVSFLYRLKGLDEVGQTQISNPIQLTLTILGEDKTDPMVKVLDGSVLEIKEGFTQSTVSDYFKEEESQPFVQILNLVQRQNRHQILNLVQHQNRRRSLNLSQRLNLSQLQSQTSNQML